MSIADELEQLDKLRRNGTLSEEEFRLAKQRVISGESDRGTRFTTPEFFEPADRVMAERRLGMFLHLSMLLGLIIPGAGFAVPILIWQIKKDDYESIDRHGRNATNWLFSWLIYTGIGILLLFVLIGAPLLWALGVCSIVFPIVAALKANEGRFWKYPLSIQFFSTS
ncbi:MAG: DUF4870 domain-containing protein [Planctomycetota bacterium]|jgi:uncharacterized Tic20 family protein